MVKKKVILMGRAASGKTSMRSIIFANYIARDTQQLSATADVESSNVRFLGNLSLNLMDFGGQDNYIDTYFSVQKNHIFNNVAVLIYVLDVSNKDPQKDMTIFRQCIEAMIQHSPDAKVFCLIHKMDLLNPDQGQKVFRKWENDLSEIARPLDVTFFMTSIWDETLYLAWSSIVYSLIPNVKSLENQLKKFSQVCGASEIVLFERSSFLVISYANVQPHDDAHRFEKISNIIKQFKLSCSKVQAHVQQMEIRNSNFATFISLLTVNTYIMVITSDPSIQSSAIDINIDAARPHFEKFLQADSD
eukprot:TRINITY_DN3368_c0_g1_i1.p1 TRINITY_DN3368_c0_g1~~TRINITY_DN3368_c0_g1_i1.p1  ORF type:complete len:303 (+),score=142.27 TRINITY_DN3368_c0_g1_i1:26-934(+)